MHVCERVLCTLVMVLVEGRDNKFPGAGVTAVVSCLARVLGIKLGSSVRVSMLNCSAPSRPIAAFVKHGHTEVGGSDAALEACHPRVPLSHSCLSMLAPGGLLLASSRLILLPSTIRNPFTTPTRRCPKGRRETKRPACGSQAPPCRPCCNAVYCLISVLPWVY